MSYIRWLRGEEGAEQQLQVYDELFDGFRLEGDVRATSQLSPLVAHRGME